MPAFFIAMSWENEIEDLLQSCVDDTAFGVEFTHIPLIGERQTLTGIWSNEYQEIEPSNGLMVMASTPVVDFKISDLVTYPTKKDTIEKSGVSYYVRAIEPDGQGAVALALEKVV